MNINDINTQSYENAIMLISDSNKLLSKECVKNLVDTVINCIELNDSAQATDDVVISIKNDIGSIMKIVEENTREMINNVFVNHLNISSSKNNKLFSLLPLPNSFAMFIIKMQEGIESMHEPDYMNPTQARAIDRLINGTYLSFCKKYNINKKANKLDNIEDFIKAGLIQELVEYYIVDLVSDSYNPYYTEGNNSRYEIITDKDKYYKILYNNINNILLSNSSRLINNADDYNDFILEYFCGGK